MIIGPWRRPKQNTTVANNPPTTLAKGQHQAAATARPRRAVALENRAKTNKNHAQHCNYEKSHALFYPSSHISYLPHLPRPTWSCSALSHPALRHAPDPRRRASRTRLRTTSHNALPHAIFLRARLPGALPHATTTCSVSGGGGSGWGHGHRGALFLFFGHRHDLPRSAGAHAGTSR